MAAAQNYVAVKKIVGARLRAMGIPEKSAIARKHAPI